MRSWDAYVLSKYGIIPPKKGIFEFCSYLCLLCEIWTLKHLESREDTDQRKRSENWDTNLYNALYREPYFTSYIYKLVCILNPSWISHPDFDSEIMSRLRDNLFSPVKEHSPWDLGSSILKTHNPHQKDFSINLILSCSLFSSLDTTDYTFSFDRLKTRKECKK